jgi:hypothetical protein
VENPELSLKTVPFTFAPLIRGEKVIGLGLLMARAPESGKIKKNLKYEKAILSNQPKAKILQLFDTSTSTSDTYFPWHKFSYASLSFDQRAILYSRNPRRN